MNLPIAVSSANKPQPPSAPGVRPWPINRSPEEVIGSVLRRLPQNGLVMTTSFGMEGVVLLEMLYQANLPVRVAWIDTDFHFEETYELIQRVQARYSRLAFERFSPALSPQEQARVYGEALWSRDPDRCCEIRKVEPLRHILDTASVWITALRRSQSPTRAGIEHVMWDWRHNVLKVSPLADWSREQVWEFIQSHGLPFNPLHERGYPSIGCTHCTKPVAGAGPADYTRQGRWQGTGKTECGLHGRYPAPGHPASAATTDLQHAAERNTPGSA